MPPKLVNNGYKPIIYNLLRTFKDPLNRGLLSITGSSTTDEVDDITPNNLIYWDKGIKWMSGRDPNQYFIIDFKVAYYYIKSYAFLAANDHALVNWEVQGSLNGQNWTTIGEGHENICKDHMIEREADKVLICEGNIEKYYDVNNEGIFRYIKVKQTGRNSESEQQHAEDNYGNTFYLNSFEVYGVLYAPFRQCTNECEVQQIIIYVFIFIISIK